MAPKDINEEVSRCIIKMLLKEPFFAHLLSGVVREIGDRVPTAAVGLRGSTIKLFVNEKFFLKELTTGSSRVAVIKHETLHLVFKHIFRMDIDEHDPLLFNIAADIVVNQFIGSWKLPDSAVTLATFPDLDLEPDQSLDWYYEKLASLARRMRRKHRGCLKRERRPETESRENADADTGSDWSDSPTPRSAEALEKIYGAPTHSEHSTWGIQPDEGGLRSSAQLAGAESELERMVIQARDRTPVQSRGTIPGAINALIDAMIERRKPKVDWKRALRLFSTSSRRTRVAHTIKRVSKRYGTRPGIRIKHFQKMAVIIDTSGSVTDHDLSLFFAEIHGMWRGGAELEVIECDAEVQRHYPYRGKLPEFVTGRGGTDFDPAFRFLRQNRQMQFDGAIYLTDGYAEEPEIRPPCKLLWVITPDGNTGDHLKYGRTIQLPD
jgi:predicted metal-dependent peptidase